MVTEIRDGPPVVTLVEKAARGDECAWNDIVRRYGPLVWSVCRRYRITGADADDVAGAVWLQLVASLATIRQPAALPGWLSTTTRRECLALLRISNRQIPTGECDAASQDGPEIDARLLIEERRNALCDAFAQLSERARQLLFMLFSDPPAPYSQISSTLGMPIGAIGPTRQRCLAQVRHNPAVAALRIDEHRR